MPFEVPAPLGDFWSIARKAFLFKDLRDGQWGLEILDPLEALKATKDLKRARPRAYLRRDLVVGRFLGDGERLVLRCDAKSADFGSVVVALEIYPRPEWPIVAADFEQFLARYLVHAGDKYWEASAALV